MEGDDAKRTPPEYAEVTAFDPSKITLEKSYCPLKTCAEWGPCRKRLFPFVKAYCAKLQDI